MKRFLTYVLLLLVLAPASALAQGRKSYVIGFYNLENLFDTYHDEGKNDYEYLPDGANEWTEFKYEKKLANMAKVIRAMRDENKAYHAILGVSEIENRHVLEDLVAQEAIADAHYQIVHYDGPDRRGVDVALLYRPELFTVLVQAFHVVDMVMGNQDGLDATQRQVILRQSFDDLRRADTCIHEDALILLAHIIAVAAAARGEAAKDERRKAGKEVHHKSFKAQK